VICIGAFVHGAVGFGMGLVTAPLLLLIDANYVPGPLLICVLVLTLLMIIRDKKAIDFRGLGWGFVGRIIGTVIAVNILSYLSGPRTSIVCAGLILFAVILSVLKIRAKLTIPTLITAGSVSGIMSTLSSVGGPPLALLYQYENGEKLRATMSGFFLLGNLISVLGLAVAGEFNANHLSVSLPLIPGVLVGFLLSNRVISKLDTRNTRPVVLLVSGLSSLIVILRTIVS
jgi:uncharacterized membrane protein YfcA